jgi:hypothetical protein
MTNERLRGAILASGYGLQGFADHLSVDRKTVERWIAGRRLPYQRHQFAIASQLGLEVSYLFPDARSPDAMTAAGQAEVLAIYPHRSVVPDELWMSTFETARSQLDVLVYSGLFLAESSDFHKLLRSKSRAGVAVRILLGDPDGIQIAHRGRDEGIGEAMASRIRNALVLYDRFLRLRHVEFRLHDLVLYNSIYRADDRMLVNTHVYGVAAFLAPVLHLRQLAGADLFMTYADSFERVWESAKPV